MTDIDDGPLDPDFYKRHEWEMPHPTRYIGDDGGSNLDALCFQADVTRAAIFGIVEGIGRDGMAYDLDEDPEEWLEVAGAVVDELIRIGVIYWDPDAVAAHYARLDAQNAAPADLLDTTANEN